MSYLCVLIVRVVDNFFGARKGLWTGIYCGRDTQVGLRGLDRLDQREGRDTQAGSRGLDKLDQRD